MAQPAGGGADQLRFLFEIFASKGHTKLPTGSPNRVILITATSDADAKLLRHPIFSAAARIRQTKIEDAATRTFREPHSIRIAHHALHRFGECKKREWRNLNPVCSFQGLTITSLRV